MSVFIFTEKYYAKQLRISFSLPIIVKRNYFSEGFRISVKGFYSISICSDTTSRQIKHGVCQTLDLMVCGLRLGL